MAIRGQRLALIRVWSSVRGFEPGQTSTPMIGIVEIDADNRLAAAELFDSDNVDAAFEELESRYRAGEAAPYQTAWSVIAQACAYFNRHEVPATTPDSVAVEHRQLLSTDATDLASAIRAVWDLTPDARMHIETVHRLSELGAVITYVLKGTSQDGFDAEWRMVEIFTVEGDLISGVEVFDEADLDDALARFDELNQPPTENDAPEA
jgi:hypothetical protein